jgi:type I restriction enzyme S subunit
VSELPKGWIETKISDVTEYVQRGKGPKYTDVKSFPVINQKAIRWFGIQEEHLKYVREDMWDKYTEERFIRSGDILWNSTGTGTIGRACLLDEKEAAKAKVVDSHVTIVRSNKSIDPRYLFNWIKSPRIQFDIDSLSTGTTNQVELSKAKVLDTSIPLAPLNEQIRIADKLDSMLAKVDTSQARLDKIPNILKRFRQSVLAAATSGELTKEWRSNNKYKKTNLSDFEIPECWEFLTIEDIAMVKGGKRLPKGEELTDENTGLPYIRAGQLKNGTVIQGENVRSKQLYLEAHVQEQIKRYTVCENDVYLTIVGASIGDSGVIPAKCHGANLTENAAKITEFTKQVNSKFLAYWLRSERLQALIKLEIKSGAQGKLALKRIKTLPTPFPNFDEQSEIVRRVESLFTMADTVEKQYKAAKARTNRLTQSILAKAFCGELVEQDENDEPASQLLERIKKQLVDTPKPPQQTPSTKEKEDVEIKVAQITTESNLPKSEILTLLQKSNSELTAQQIMTKLTEKTFDQVDMIFTELKRLLDNHAIAKVGIGENCTFKAVKK